MCQQVPCTADLLATSGMQLALLVQPLALPHPSEEPIQVCDYLYNLWGISAHFHGKVSDTRNLCSQENDTLENFW